MKLKQLFFGFALLLAQVTLAQNYYLHCGSILDTKSGKILSNKTIVVAQNKIIKIQEGFVAKANPNDIEVDLKNKFVLPGLIDLHVHIEGELNSKSYVSKYIDNEADVAFQAVNCAEITLLAGFTTV